AGGHDHAHGMTGRKLRTAFLLTAIILLVELVGGVISHSLALLYDAGHVLTDIFALGLARATPAVLIVEDDALAHTLLQTYVTRAGYRPIAASCSMGGLAVLERAGVCTGRGAGPSSGTDRLRPEPIDCAVVVEGAVANLDLARDEPPGLVRLDLMMPGLDGWEVLCQPKGDALTVGGKWPCDGPHAGRRRGAA